MGRRGERRRRRNVRRRCLLGVVAGPRVGLYRRLRRREVSRRSCGYLKLLRRRKRRLLVVDLVCRSLLRRLRRLVRRLRRRILQLLRLRRRLLLVLFGVVGCPRCLPRKLCGVYIRHP